MEKQFLKYLYKQSDENLELIFNISFDLYHSEFKKIDASQGKKFLLALEKTSSDFAKKEKFKKRKNRDVTLEEISEIEAENIERFREKKSPKKSKLELQFKHLIMRLRKENFSWQKISDYLAENHKFRVHFSTIQKQHKIWEKEYDKRD
jgi:ribosomal protein L20A (L18A)